MNTPKFLHKLDVISDNLVLNASQKILDNVMFIEIIIVVIFIVYFILHNIIYLYILRYYKIFAELFNDIERKMD